MEFRCSMFDDQGIERSQIIKSELTRAIRESRISIVVLSKNYASSGWCLDELVEIFECKEYKKQIVMTVFYGVDPSHVRKQTGDFGKVFKKTCARKTEEERRKWSKALTDASNIAGEHLLNWDKESEMIEKIARDVSNKLNVTISRDFEDMVGIEAHLEKMQSLLNLDYEEEAMIVGICGPAGIGKTTIARASRSRFSSSFDLTCFMENIRGSYNTDIDEYGAKMCLQEKLLSKILNQNGTKLHDLGTIQERLCDLKVLIILDDVDDLQQLEALANETNWFGPGSRIIVTTEDQDLLQQHGINNTYHVDFPTKVEARKIFYRHAFTRRSLAPDGYEKLAERVADLCSNLPLGLRVMGSSLRGKKEHEWESILHRLENSSIPKIDAVLRVGYESLHEDDQLLFVLIALFFNYEEDGHVEAMLADSNLNVRLETLAYKSLIKISTKGTIVMHKLLQQVGRQAIQRQEPWKRQVLIDTNEICDVLENDTGRRSLMGISFDVSTIEGSMEINAGALKSMRNLRFLRIYKTRRGTNVRVQLRVPEDINLPPRLRLLHWEVYPGKCLPQTFCPEYLVELNLGWNQLEKLWDGTLPLPNLKKMDLLASMNLKKLPDLSKATNLEKLVLRGCASLEKIPSSFGKLHKLESLVMDYCTQLQGFPTDFNLASLKRVEMVGCWQLRKIPDISTNITKLTIAETMLEEVPRLWSRLETLIIYGSANISQYSVEKFTKRSGADIEKIPEWIKNLHGLAWLHITGCPKLASIPELPGSLKGLIVDTCESLETLSFSFDSPILFLDFPNCFKLGQEARRVITEQSFKACLPGRNIPVEFVHRAIGNFLTIRSDFKAFRVCVVVSPKQGTEASGKLLCRICINGYANDGNIICGLDKFREKHLCIRRCTLLDKEGWLEQGNEISFQFSTASQNIDIIECGVQILTDETNRSIECDVQILTDETNRSISSQGSYETRPEQVSDRRKNEFGVSRSKLISPINMYKIFIFVFPS